MNALITRGEVMTKRINMKLIKTISSIFIAAIIISAPFNVHARVADKVTTYKDAKGWKLQVGDKDHYVKGVVWGYTPRGQNYSYNLWGQPEAFVRKVLDHEFSLMKKANINTIRSFSTIPPKWVTYAYEEYGIMTAINPLMGRYGATINGVWTPVTNYSDPATREFLIAEVAENVAKYKGVPGVIMIALGNESNYGLEWSASFEIENLPEGEQHKEKARSLYSLYYEVIERGKAIDPDRLFSIVNGDLQYKELIKEYVTNLDVLGVNAYRGIGFTGLWKDVDEMLDLPVLFFEFGADAFNSKDFVEDQASQASFLRGQWQEMYNKSYGNGQEGNSVGGFVFEWRDEWWKYKQTENLDVQDRNASWGNGGYTYDFVEGQNNMNEEWWGIMRLGPMNEDGIYVAEPRMAYDMLTDVWRIDPYRQKTDSINADMSNLDMGVYALKADIAMLKSINKEKDKFTMTGGNFRAELMVNGFQNDIKEKGEDGLTFQNAEMLFLDFAFQPNKNLSGDFTINILNNVADSQFEFRYGDRGLPTSFQSTVINEGSFNTTDDIEVEGRERVELYDFQATYETPDYTLKSFYHVPRYHWGDKGDFFGLLHEATDMEGQDIWNAKAPFGVELIGKRSAKGLNLVVGPEIYWGANPKALLKYQFDSGGTEYTFMHSEDIARRADSSSATEATVRQSRQTVLSAKTDISGVKLEVGGIISGSEKLDETYTRVEQGNIVVSNQIDFKDLLGARAKVTFDLLGARTYVAMHYAGLVADAGNPTREFYTELPYSALGNKKEIEAGALITIDKVMIYPRLLYRENIVDANPIIEPSITGSTLSPGVSPRNRDDDPFAVLDNREAKSAELYITYDPTPGSFFYDWDNDMREDAEFAFNVGLTATHFTTPTDSNLFFFIEGNTNAPFGEGLTEEDVWLLKSKLVFNTSNDMKLIVKMDAGKQQTTGLPIPDAVGFSGIEAKFIFDKRHIISTKFRKDDWGPYDFERQFNLTYPRQFNFDYAYLLDNLADEKKSSMIGIKTFYRTLGVNSAPDFYQEDLNKYMFEIQAYLRLNF